MDSFENLPIASHEGTQKAQIIKKVAFDLNLRKKVCYKL